MFKKWFLRDKKLKSSIFMVILWINLVSIVVLTFFNYYVFHRMSDKAYRESFLSYNQRVTNLAFENIDKQIMQPMLRIWQLHFSTIKENDLLLQSQNITIAQSSEDTRALVREMRTMQMEYPYIKSIDIYYEATGTIVTGFDKVHYTTDKENIDRYLPWYEEYEKNGKVSGLRWQPDGIYLVDEPVITYVKRITSNKWGEKDVVLAIHILPSSFKEYIDLESGNLTLVTSDNLVLYTTEPEGGRAKMIDKVFEYANNNILDLREDTEPLFLETVDEPVTIFHTNLATSGLMYLYSISDSAFYRDYSITSRMFLLNFFISIAFNIVILGVISIYYYKTYHKRVLNMSKNAGIDMGMSDQSFDSSLSTLTKEITTLHATVNSSKGLLFQNAVRSVILNRKTEGAYDTILPYLKGDSVCTFFLCLSEKAAERVSIEGLQAEYPLEKRSYNVLFTMIEKYGLVAIVILDHKNGKRDLADFIKDMKKQYEGCSVVYGSMLPNQKDGLKNSYKSTIEISRYCFIFPEKKVLVYEDIKLEGRKESGSHLKLFEAMEKDIKNENLLDFKTHMEYLITSFKNGNYAIDYCISTLRDLVTWMYQTMQHNQLDMWVVFGYDIREYYRQIPNIDIYYDWMNGLCEVILKNIRQRKKQVDSNIQARVVKMIEDHLEDDISLDYIAEQLNIRSDVASRMFKQMMGSGYTEYIKEKKLNRAIELLKQDCNVKDIAQKLGYSSAQYFIKVFKEEYGVTPHQYKKSQKSEN